MTHAYVVCATFVSPLQGLKAAKALLKVGAMVDDLSFKKENDDASTAHSVRASRSATVVLEVQCPSGQIGHQEIESTLERCGAIKVQTRRATAVLQAVGA